MKRLLVVGGGIAGLTGARAALAESARHGMSLEVVVAEAGSRVGGKIRTEPVDGVPLEWGPDGFLASRPEVLGLCEALGLATVPTGPLASSTYLRRGGRFRPLPPGLAMGVPTGLRPLLGAARRGIVGPAAAARAALEPLVPRRVTGDTAGALLRRRLGEGATDRLVAPIVQGILGTPVDEIAVEAVPGLAGGGSLMWRAVRGGSSGGAGRPVFHTIVGGMTRLPEALVTSMPDVDVRLGAPVRALSQHGRGWLVVLDDQEMHVDAVLLAIPPSAAGALLRKEVSGADRLAGVHSSSTAVVHLGWVPGAIRRPDRGSGYLADPQDDPVVSAATFLSAKWPHLGCGERVRAAINLPGVLAGADDRELGRRAAREVGEALDATAAPTDVRVHRWTDGSPAPTPAHRRILAEVTAATPQGLALAGIASGALGLPDCVRTGELAGRRLAEALAG